MDPLETRVDRQRRTGGAGQFLNTEVADVGKTRMRMIAGTGLVALLALGLTACGSGAAPSGGTAPSGTSGGKTTVTVGTTPLVSSAPLYLAKDMGFWDKYGIQVDLKTFQAAQPISVATAAGDLDVSATGVTASLFNLYEGGKKMYLVADKGRIWPGQHFQAFLVSNKAWDAGLTSAQGLKGKKVGISQTGSTFDYLLGKYLEQNGMKLSDVTRTPLGELTNMASALESGQVDAAILPQPFADKLLNSHKAHLLVWLDDEVKTDLLAVAYSPKFAQNRDAAVRFMEGYIESTKWYMDHVFNAKNPKDPDYQKALSIIGKYTSEQPDQVAKELVYVDPQGALWADNIQEQLDWYKAQGFVKGNVQAKDVIDTSFQQEALKKLGQ